METTFYDIRHQPDPATKGKIIEFLHRELGVYGDPADQIAKAIEYAVEDPSKPGGALVILRHHEQIAGAAVINRTGMEPYIPDNILVYIAVASKERGKGLGHLLLTEILNSIPGDFALHVEPENPAARLYKKMGFSSKYQEMRLKREAK